MWALKSELDFNPRSTTCQLCVRGETYLTWDLSASSVKWETADILGALCLIPSTKNLSYFRATIILCTSLFSQGHLTQQLPLSRQCRIICGWLTLSFYNSVCGQVLVERRKKNSNLQSVLACGICCNLPFFFMNCLSLQSPFWKRNGVGKSVVKQSWHHQWDSEP